MEGGERQRPKAKRRAAYVAYLAVQSRAVASKACLFVLYWLAISGTRGSSGLGSVKRDEIDNKTLEMVSAGLHWSFKMSKQIAPFLLI